jgi:hypothetical protein
LRIRRGWCWIYRGLLVEGAALTQKASRVLQLLELEALRARYHSFEPRMLEIKRVTGRSLVLLEIIQTASSHSERRAQAREARLLPWHLRILVRRFELATDGIWLRVLSSNDRGPDELTVFVEFNERGRRVLAGNSLALSSALAFIRRFLWLGFFTVAVVVITLYLGERVWRQGWQQALVGICAVVAFTVLTRKLWR